MMGNVSSVSSASPFPVTAAAREEEQRQAVMRAQVALAMAHASDAQAQSLFPVSTSIAPAPAASAASAASTAPAASDAQEPQQDKVGDHDDNQRQIQDDQPLYTPYQPQIDWYAHPTKSVHTTTMKYATPKIDPVFLHPDIRYNSKLSAAQLEAIAQTGEAGEKGFGFLLGHGTGFGKGAILAGCMLNFLKFHPDAIKYIFVSASAQLKEDLERDLKRVSWPLHGKNALPVRGLSDPKSGWRSEETIRLSKGVLFVTYATLRACFSDDDAGKKKNGKRKRSRSRVEQILEWATSGSKRSNGVIVFDEVHFAKDEKTATSQAVAHLQEKLPDFRVIYASATAMSSVGHLSALTRLGLWGPGTPYANYKAFEEKWKNQTRSGLEVVASELAAQGLYTACRLSLEGTEFRTSCAKMTPVQLELHSQLCKWWSELANIDNVLRGVRNRARLWGAHLSFFKALLVAFRADHCVELAEKAIAEGGSVVISLIGTGESIAKRVVEERGEEAMEDGFVALQEIMKSIVQHAIDDYQGASVPDIVYELRDRISEFDLPPSPLDYLIYKLSLLKREDGKNQRVIEMTGRKGGFYKENLNSDDAKWVYQDRKMSNLEGCRLFQQNGKDVIAIISAAASTGISLHNTTSRPSRHRTQIMLELSYAADQAMQTYGRTNRTDQHDSPTYVLVFSDLDAEGRFAAMVSKRAAELGALTTGDRRGVGSDIAFGSDLLVGSHSIEAIQKLHRCFGMRNWPKWGPCTRDANMNPIEDWDEFIGSVSSILKSIGVASDSKPTQLMGRLLGVSAELSNKCMSLYEAACMEAWLNSEAVKAEKADLGVEDVFIGRKSKIIDVSTGGLINIATDIGVSMDDALEKAKKARDEFGTKFMFATRIDDRTQRVFNVLAQNIKAHVRVTRPNGRVAAMTTTDFRALYSKISEPKDSNDEYPMARKAWDKEFELCMHTCVHGKSCKFGAECTFGKRCVNTSLIKMPGALNALRGYVGPKQIIRITDLSEGNDAPKHCVAVRISNAKHFDTESLEDDLLAERKRQEDMEKRVAEKKELIVEKVNQLNSATSAASSSSNVASTSASGLSSDSDDSDSDEEYKTALRRSTRKKKTRILIEDSSDEEDDANEKRTDMCGSDEEAPKPRDRSGDVDVDAFESMVDSESEEDDPEEDDSDDEEI